MPYMMDELDELFRDAVPATQVQPPGLRERVDELKRVGCCDKLTWAPSGVLASVAEDNTSVQFASYRYDDGRWIESQTTPAPLPNQIKQVLEGSHIAHLSFNPHSNGCELVVIDVFGRIFCCGPWQYSYDRYHVLYAFNSTRNDLNRVVGMHWLAAAKDVALNRGQEFWRETRKQASNWKYGSAEFLPAIGPCNPIPASMAPQSSRPAFLALTAAGKLSLYYNKQEGKPAWESVSIELFHFESSNISLTHAAFSSIPGVQYPNGEIWVASIDSASQLHVRSIMVKWQVQQDQPQTATPRLTCSTIVSTPLYSPQSSSGLVETSPPTHASFIRMVMDRTGPAAEKGNPLVIIGSHMTSAQDPGMGPGQPRTSIVTRFALEKTSSQVDPCFGSLNSKQTARHTPAEQLYVKRLPDEVFEGVILDVREHRRGSMLLIPYSDGRIEFRDRDLKIPPLETSSETMNGLPAIGFSFNGGEPCLYNIASPNACVRATMGLSHTPKFQPIQVSVPLMEVTDADFKAKASAIFGLELLNAPHSAEIVDLMVAIRAFSQQLGPDQDKLFQVNLLHHYGGDGVDLFSKFGEMDKLMPPQSGLMRWLSLQEAMGHVGGSIDRSQPSLEAYLLLNIRHIFMVLNASTVTAPGQTRARISTPEICEYVGHSIRWITALVDWIFEQVMIMNRNLNYATKFETSQLNFQPHELSANTPPNTHVACALVAAPFSRNLLKAVVNRINLLHTGVYSVLDPQDQGPEWEPYEKSLKENVYKLQLFSRFLASCEQLWRKIHTDRSAGARGAGSPPELHPEHTLRQQEAHLMECAQFSNHLNIHFLAQLVTAGADTLRKTVDEGALATRDFTMLGFGMDTAAKEWRRRNVWDGAAKKVVGKKNAREGASGGKAPPEMRECVRCGTKTEDPVSRKGASAALQSFLMTVSKNCPCGGVWVTVLPSQT